MELFVKGNCTIESVLKAFADHRMPVTSRNGEIVSVEHSDVPGFTVAPAEDGYALSYCLLPDLCRGLLYLLSCKERLTCSVHEECAFADFGVMMDASRNAVPKVETVKEMIFYAACMGYRYVGLYMEDTLEVPQEPYFGYMRGRLTCSEIREMDAYALSLGMELRPFVQTLAHLNQITRYERYQNIIDTADILLVGHPDTEKLIDHILEAVCTAFSSRNINIGMDEAMLLGAGKYLERNGFHAKSEIMLEQLNTVLRLCKKHGLHPQMWSDMFRHAYDRGERFQVPEDVEIVYWDYYSTEVGHYADVLRQHREMSSHVSFAGGAWKWTGFAPHNGYSLKTGEAAIAACKEQNITGFLLASFGDDGAEASFFSVLPAMFCNAGLSFDSKMSLDAFAVLTGICFADFMKLDLPNPYLENFLVHNNASKYFLYNDPLIGTFDSVLREDTVERFRQASDSLRSVPGNDRFDYLFETLMHLSRALTVKADLGVRIRKSYRAGDRESLKAIAEETIPQLLLDLQVFYRAFETQWKRESKSFGFEVQTIRFGALRQRLEDTAWQLQQYMDGTIARIEELEQEQLPFAYFENNEIDILNYNLWSDIVSPGVIG